MKILNLDSDAFAWSYISHFKDENIAVFLTLLSICSPLSFFHSSLVLLLCLFLLLHNSLHPMPSELCHKSIHTRIRRDRERVLNFQKLICRVLVSLKKSGIDHCVNNFELKLAAAQRKQNALLRWNIRQSYRIASTSLFRSLLICKVKHESIKSEILI